ncbi:MAG TPA: glycosyltransferase family 4 protein [Aggregatilineales bacterium]|nr:glycosyltransferase family 4 protein [Aggregatilineales bacterium]
MNPDQAAEPSLRPLRILAIAPTPFFVDRGGHVQIDEQARALQKLGNTLELCTYHIGRDRPDLTIRRIGRVPWYNKTDAGPALGKLYLMVLVFMLAYREIRRFKPDILHGHGWDGCWIAFALYKLTGTPFVFDMQGSFTGEIVAHGYATEKSVFSHFLKWLERRTLHLGTVVTQSEQMVHDAIADFGVRPDHIFHTFDGVDTDRFRPGLDASDLREALKLPAGKKVVVFVGLLKPYQGVDSLLDAIRILVADFRYTGAHFLIMGFPDEDVYAQRAAHMGVGEFCTFPGKIDYDQLPRYLALGDVAVAPKLSPTEGDGKIYNYLANGLPIVAYDRPASKEILGDLAVYAKLGDSHSLACALREALTNEKLAADLAAKGRALAVERFSWLAVARRLMVAYHDVLRRAGKERA